MAQPISQISERILHLPEHAVAICRPCGLALRPKLGIKRHLKDIHGDWTLRLRREIIQYTSQLSLVEPDEVVEPLRGWPPIAGLTIYNGRKCDQCPYVSSMERSMQ